MQRSLILAAGALTLAASPALAHTGTGDVSGLTAGFGHPIGGLDHLLAMLAVGVLAAQRGGKSTWLLPATFVAVMIVAGAAAMAGVALPFVELGIVGSVVVLGIVIASGRAMPAGAAMALVGLMAVFHGHAHGTEMPLGASGIGYAIGFAVATAMLHAAGIGLVHGARAIARKFGPVAIRAGGGAIAAAGTVLLVA